jgi:hypothetical protein
MGGLFCGVQDFGDVLVARLTELVYDLVLLDLGQIDGERIRRRKNWRSLLFPVPRFSRFMRLCIRWLRNHSALTADGWTDLEQKKWEMFGLYTLLYAQ